GEPLPPFPVKAAYLCFVVVERNDIFLTGGSRERPSVFLNAGRWLVRGRSREPPASERFAV
ncbi:MAG: hypothetical protein WBZ19_23745, partial [Chthoniobacterales bacterium]